MSRHSIPVLTGALIVCCLIGGASLAVAGQAASGDSSAMEKLVPESSRHAFLPIDPAWVKRAAYLKPAGDEAFEVVPMPEPNRKQRLYSHITYFLPGKETDPSAYTRLLAYDADGRLLHEVDQTPTERFEREFYPDGSPAGYLHWQQEQGVVSAYNLDPHGKTIARVQNGEGEHLSWIFGPDDYTHGWLHKGAYLLTKIYRQKKRTSTTFWLLSGDDLRITPSEERLTLSAQKEYWTRPVRGDVYGQVGPAMDIAGAGGKLVKQNGSAPPPDAIHQRLMIKTDFVRNRRPEDAARALAQTGQDYRTRRDAFVRRYRAFLEAAHREDLIPEIMHFTSP